MTVIALNRERLAASAPPWASNFSHDVRVWDRREGRYVGDHRHHVRVPTDLMVSNAHIRFTVGGRGDIPYLAVEAVADGRWRHQGYLFLVQSAVSHQVLADARLVCVTPERVGVCLSVADLGNVFVWLYRGERMLGVAHAEGGSRLRSLGWSGLPPFLAANSLFQVNSVFGRGLRVISGGVLEMVWPSAVTADEWAISGWWQPFNASSGGSAQADSGLLQLDDSGGPVSTLTYEASTRTLRWSQGAVTLASAPLTFAANQGVFFALSHSSRLGRGLTARAGSAVSYSSSPTATDPGTSEERYSSLVIASVGGSFTATPLGSGALGAGAAGGGSWAGGSPQGGDHDALNIFDGPLTEEEAEALSEGAVQDGGLPAPEARRVWSAPFDSLLEPHGSNITGGAMYESSLDGSPTRWPDPYGLLRGIVVPRASTMRGPGLMVREIASSFEAAAFVATDGTEDDYADHVAQYVALNREETLIRA